MSTPGRSQVPIPQRASAQDFVAPTPGRSQVRIPQRDARRNIS